ncbi:MAG: hypothetical protein HY329_24535 [Chloroflexi bacterium]|nr:hypothetical protein [Chloroflexota bacterium]
MQEITLTITGTALREVALGLVANPARLFVCPAGVSRLSSRIELLVHRTGWPAGAARGDAAVFVLGAAEPNRARSSLETFRHRLVDPPLAIVLALGVGPAAGWAAAICVTPDGDRPLRSCTIVGGDGGLGLGRISFETPPDPARRAAGE